MSEEYKPKDEVPNLYSILGLTPNVCKEKNCNEIIQKAYVKKAKVCHPDRYPGRKDVEELFELITSAYDILKDEKTRNTYNHKLSLNKQSSGDFFKLKQSTKDYMESLGEYKEPTDQQKLSFKEKMKALDLKHGYDPSIESTAIPKNDARKKMNDLKKMRDTQDVDLKPPQLFQEGQFDIKKFNAAFDKYHKRNDDAIMPHNGAPSAWNDLGTTANFSTFDNLDNLYVNDGNRYDTNRDLYANTDFGSPTTKINPDDIRDLKGADYVDGHNIIDDNYYKDMKSRLSARKEDATKFDNMKYDDFKRNDTAGYGIFDQLGFDISENLTFDLDDDDISKKFEKLMAERQRDMNPANYDINTDINNRKMNSSWR